MLTVLVLPVKPQNVVVLDHDLSVVQTLKEQSHAFYAT